MHALYPQNIRRLAKHGADLFNRESVKNMIAKLQVKNDTKMQYVTPYDILTKTWKYKGIPQTCNQEETTPFIADESELDCLIAVSQSKRFAALLQALREMFGTLAKFQKSAGSTYQATQ